MDSEGPTALTFWNGLHTGLWEQALWRREHKPQYRQHLESGPGLQCDSWQYCPLVSSSTLSALDSAPDQIQAEGQPYHNNKGDH